MPKILSLLCITAALAAAPQLASAQALDGVPHVAVSPIMAIYHTALGTASPTFTTVTGSTSLLTPLLDAASAGALHIGTTTATSIVLDQNTSMTGAATFGTGTGAVAVNGAVTFAANKGVTVSAGTSAFDFSGGTGVFKSSTGAVTLGSGVVSVTGAFQLPAGAQSSTPYTLGATDFYQAITTGNSAFTVTLPACVSGTVGRTYLVKKIDTGTGAVILAPNGTDTIDGTNANAQFAGDTSSGSSETHGRFSYVAVTCRAAGAWDVTGEMISYGAALNNASPSVWTVTVPTGARCVCNDATTAANGVKCNVSTTTLTATGPNTTTDVVNALCFF